MLIILILNLFFESAFVQKSRRPKSFTFMNNQNREFTLKKGNTNRNPNFIKRLSKKILGRSAEEDDDDSEGWYYIHVLEDNLNQVRRIVNINTESTLLKNTYAVYLKGAQVEALENITLVRKLTKEDKFHEDGGSITATNYLQVITKEHSNIEERKGLYRIERQDDDHTYILEVDVKGLKEKASLNKKKEAIEYLSSLRYVKTVSTFQYPTIKNAVFTGYTQKNSVPIQTDSATGLKYLPRYINDGNYRGEGQIITIQDTPIDFYHDMFRDSSLDVQFNTKIVGHRKFVYYGTKSSSKSDWSSKLEVNEHGTHVACTVAGKSECSSSVGTSLYNGNAPDAKILYAGDLNDVKSSDLGRLMKEYDSYISTNSWGVNGYNDNYNHEYGKLAYDNPERLFLFAAGNEYSDGNFTVCDPGGSKNVLTVGAMSDFFNDLHVYSISTYSITIRNVIALLDADPWTSGSIGTSTSSDVVVINPADGEQCKKINSGKISLLYASSIRDSSLSWIYKCKLESTSGILFTDQVGSINQIINSGTVTVTDETSINGSYAILHADYSSGGPGNKGILKPDIMTPGTRIISAKSRARSSSPHGCQTKAGNEFTYMQGTSMATPNAAGAAALVREYFKKASPWQVDLDGPTLRALMINSCKHPHNSLTPDVLFGHGIVDLSTIIPLNSNFGVLMTGPNQLPSIGENDSLYAEFYVSTPNQKIQITLSYLDPELEASSSIPLTRDLDLVVVTPDNRVFKGDHLENGDTQHYSTNEKVIISDGASGNYKIFVLSSEFVDSGTSNANTQNFAVVVSGEGITSGFLSFSKSTTCPCQICNPQDRTRCLCDDSSIGNLCQAKIQKVNGTKASVRVAAMEVARIMFTTNKNIKIIKSKSSSPGKQQTIWYSSQCHANIGDYDNSGQTGSLRTKETKVDPALKNICVAVANINYQSATYDIELSEKSSKTTTIIIVVVVVVVVIIGAGVAVYCLWKKGKCSKLPVCGNN